MFGSVTAGRASRASKHKRRPGMSGLRGLGQWPGATSGALPPPRWHRVWLREYLGRLWDFGGWMHASGSPKIGYCDDVRVIEEPAEPSQPHCGYEPFTALRPGVSGRRPNPGWARYHAVWEQHDTITGKNWHFVGWLHTDDPTAARLRSLPHYNPRVIQ